MRAGAVIRSPSLAIGHENTYVVGNNLALFDTAPSPPRPLIAVTGRGEDIGRPAGDFVFASPRAVLDGDGILHVVWAEPREPRPVRREDWMFLSSRFASLWHATYASERGWSQPERVYGSSRISWVHGTGDLAFDSLAGLNGVTADDSARALIHMTFRAGQWHSDRIPRIASVPVYSSIAASGDGRLYVAYVDADRSVRSDANSVFLVRSPDAGRTWLPPQLISRSGENRATQIEAMVSPDGTVHLVWAQNLSGELLPEVVRHIASRDGGETWSPAEDVDVPDGFGTLHAVADGCGAVHLAYEVVVEPGAEGGSERGQLWYARWAGGWTALAQPFGDLNSTEVALAASPGGSPLLVWSIIHPANDVYQTTFSSVVSSLELHP